jgi:hypothetical protein
MPLSAEHAIDGANEEEALCGGLITKVIRKKKVARTDKKLNMGPGGEGWGPAFPRWNNQNEDLCEMGLDSRLNTQNVKSKEGYKCAP